MICLGKKSSKAKKTDSEKKCGCRRVRVLYGTMECTGAIGVTVDTTKEVQEAREEMDNGRGHCGSDSGGGQASKKSREGVENGGHASREVSGCTDVLNHHVTEILRVHDANEEATYNQKINDLSKLFSVSSD